MQRFISVFFLYTLTGLVTLLMVLILRSPGLDTKDVADILDWIFMTIFPNYSLAQSFMNIYTNYMNQQICLPHLPYCDTIRSPCCSSKSGFQIERFKYFKYICTPQTPFQVDYCDYEHLTAGVQKCIWKWLIKNNLTSWFLPSLFCYCFFPLTRMQCSQCPFVLIMIEWSDLFLIYLIQWV